MYKKILLPIVLSILCVSCTEFFDTDTSLQKNIESTPPTLSIAKASIYLDEDATPQKPLHSSQVKFFLHPSKHRCERLGEIWSNGNFFASFDDCINAAKKEAANVGADFIILEGSGISEEEPCVLISQRWAHFTAWNYSN